MTYREGLRAVTGTGEYIDDLPTPPGTMAMAFYRSPYPHAKILRVGLSDVWKKDGIAYGPKELRKVVKNPFPDALNLPVNYYPLAA